MSSDNPTRPSPARESRGGASGPGAHLDETTLADLAAGQLTEARHQQALAHLDQCTRCRQAALLAGRNDPDVTRENIELPTDPAANSDPLIGAQLGEYVVTGALARGGMGVVYSAEQPSIGKKVAIKVLLPHAAADPNLVSRLLAEARVLAGLHHPNIVDVFSFGSTADQRHYLVMEHLPGEPLSAPLQREGRLSPREVLTILDSVLAALDAAHQAGVLHRDLKPGNIFLTPLPDGSVHVKLLDFGVAKSLAQPGLTQPNMVLGTPGYMAPEQIQGEPLSVRSDLYALGVLSWVLLTGTELFPAESQIDMMSRHLNEDPPRLSSRLPDLPEGLDELVNSLLARAPAERPASAAEARREVQRIRKRARMETTLGNPELSRLLRGPPQAGIPTIIRVPQASSAAGTRGLLLAVIGIGSIVGAAIVLALVPTQSAPTPAPKPPVLEPVSRVLAGLDAGQAEPAPDAGLVAEPEEAGQATEDAGEPAAVDARQPAQPKGPHPQPSRVPTRAEVERRLKSARAAIQRLSGANRGLALTELSALEKRLASGEAPGQVAKDLNQLLKDYGAR